MRVIIGGVYYPTIEGSSVQITRSVSDPVPTCTLNLRDITSALNPQYMQEVLVIDDQQTPNPAANLLLNPAMNPFNTDWTSNAHTGLAYATAGGGGLQITLTNAAAATDAALYQNTLAGSVVPGQTYMLSVNVQGSSSPTNVKSYIAVVWLDAGQNIISTISATGAGTVSTSLVQLQLSGVAPAGALSAQINLGVVTTSSTNSGVVTYTKAQFEPEWFPTQSYPTPWVGPSQTNCVQLPLGFYIRQYRKFAGFLTHRVAQDYHGNARTLVVNAVGYAWLMGTILGNDTFSSQADSAIISSLLSKYLKAPPAFGLAAVSMVSTTNVVPGPTVSSLQSNWDDLRTLLDGLCGLSGFYWTVDAYWNMIYAPPGYVSQSIGLICDSSSIPDLVTTFPAYAFSAETDFTQPGSTILVLGNGTNVAEIIDGSQTANLGVISGYSLPTGTSWMRKVNDSTLASTTDCTQRGMSELLQYDYPRTIYHVTTQVELIPGESIQLTSATEGLVASAQLVQQTQSTWIGTGETLTDTWEYQSDLGAANRAATNMMSRIFRTTQKGTSAPAISVTTLATLDNLNVVDTVDSNSLYAERVLVDAPVRYYRLGEPAGFSITTAYDWSGNAQNGTVTGTVTLGTSGLIANDTNTAMTFDGSTGYISLPTTGLQTGAGAWTLEGWCKSATLPTSGNYECIVGMGTNNNQQTGQIKFFNNSGTQTFVLATWFGDITGGTAVANTIYHVVGTYDGTNTRLYVNGVLVAGPTPFTMNVVQTYADIGTEGPGSDFFNGVLDEVALYNYALPPSQILKHLSAGTNKLLLQQYTTYSLYAGTVYLDHPLVYYRMGEPTGTTAYDWTLNNLHSTIHSGVTLGATGLLFNDTNTSMTFNGSTGFIALPTLGTWPTGNGPWSIEVWCKPTNSTNASNGMLIAIGNPGTTAAMGGIFQVSTGGWGVMTGGGVGHDFSPFNTSAAGAVYHLVATYDGTNLMLYVASGSGAVNVYGPFSPGTLALTTSANQAIGDLSSASFFNGRIQEAAVYNYALPQTRVQAHFNVGALGHL